MPAVRRGRSPTPARRQREDRGVVAQRSGVLRGPLNSSGRCRRLPTSLRYSVNCVSSHVVDGVSRETWGRRGRIHTGLSTWRAAWGERGTDAEVSSGFGSQSPVECVLRSQWEQMEEYCRRTARRASPVRSGWRSCHGVHTRRTLSVRGGLPPVSGRIRGYPMRPARCLVPRRLHPPQRGGHDAYRAPCPAPCRRSGFT